MKRSEKILQQNGVQDGLSWQKKKITENSILLKHIIDNDLKHMWHWIKGIVLLVLGLMAKSFIGG